MWKKRKSNADGDAPAKKYQKKTDGKESTDDGKESNDYNDDSLFACEIAKNKRVAVGNFKGTVFIDFREMYTKEGGKKFPTRKGISLRVDEWNILREHIDEIDEVVAKN